jgi:hypothetical protein
VPIGETGTAFVTSGYLLTRHLVVAPVREVLH